MNSSGLTVEQKRELVREYLDLPHGLKRQWLEAQSISPEAFTKWRTAYLAGELDRGRVPRQGLVVKTTARRIRELERALEQRDERLVELERRLEQSQAANEALGKAIGHMHQWSEHMPGPTPAPTEPEN